MVKNLAMKPFQSSFLSCEKDTEIILRKLFVESRPYSDDLKRLLVINTKDCLDDKTNPIYLKKLEEMKLPQLIQQQYITFSPEIQLEEYSEVKSFINITYDDFLPNATNPQFRDYTLTIVIMSLLEYWDLGNYRQRPTKIAGFIDGILDNSRLTGIGAFQFIGGSEIAYPDWGGYVLMYRAVHGSDDKLPESDKIV